MKPKLYLETTIPSYLAGRPSRDLLTAAHQQITRDWWESRREEFDVYASELVVQEVRAGDAHLADRRLEFLDGVPILPVSREILELAEDLIIVGPIPRNADADAAHIAIATVYGCEYLLTGIAATLPTPSCSGRYGVSSTGMGMRRRACAPRKN